MLVKKESPVCVPGSIRVMLWVISLESGSTGVKHRGFTGQFSFSGVIVGNGDTIAEAFRVHVELLSSELYSCC